MYDLITSALLFVILTPGVLLTLPLGSVLFTAIAHAVVFYVVQRFAAVFVPWWGIWVAAAVVVGLSIYRSRAAATTTF